MPEYGQTWEDWLASERRKEAAWRREATAAANMCGPQQDDRSKMDSRRKHLALVEGMLTRLHFGDGSYKIRFDGVTEERGYFDPYKRERGQDWPLHAETMVGARRLAKVRELIDEVAGNVRGDFIECGIWRGGVCILAATWDQLFDDGMHVVGFDSFEGLPAAGFYQQDDPDDPHHKVDVFRVDEGDVRRNFSKYGVHPRQYSLIKGWFRDTIPPWVQQRNRDTNGWPGIRILRVDGDMYEGTMDPLKHLGPLVNSGGYVIIDDYGDVRECRRAVHDFMDGYYGREQPELIEFDHTCVYWRQP
jgi:O-methyltransferase